MREQNINRIFIKENNTAIVGFDNYSKSLDCIRRITDTLMTDYPYLSPAEITIDIFGGDKRKGQMYAEAKVREPTKEYRQYDSFMQLL